MELKLVLSEQEQQWMHEIAEYYQLTASEVIKKLLVEQYEQLAMDKAFEMFPQGDDATSDEPSDTRSARKAELKRQMIEKATRADSQNE